MPGQKQIPKKILLLTMLLSQGGCVALNIPSQRFHDPSDHGGIFGHWDTGGQHHLHSDCQSGAAMGKFHDTSGFCMDGGPLEVDPLDPSVDVDGNPKQPEVPWPRFNPVPTRPVFGASLP